MPFISSSYPRFDALDRKIDLRFDALIDGRFAALNPRFEALDKKIDSRFMWTVGIVVTTWLTTIASIASIYLRLH